MCSLRTNGEHRFDIRTGHGGAVYVAGRQVALQDADHANSTHSNPPQRKLSHLAGAFVLGVILTTTLFFTTPLGKQAPAANHTYTTKQPAQPTSNARQTNPTNNQQPATPNGQAAASGSRATNQPADPQEALRRIQALNDYNRGLTQSNTPNLPTDPTPPHTTNHNHPVDTQCRACRHTPPNLAAPPCQTFPRCQPRHPLNGRIASRPNSSLISLPPQPAPSPRYQL